jgi:hypothetical protein
MSSPAAGLYGALGKPQLGFYINIITTPLFLFVIYLGSFGGLIWCCIFVMLFRNIVSAFHFYMSNRLLELRAMDFVKSFSPVLLTTLSVMFVFGILNNLFPSGFIIYAVVYFVSILLLLRFSSQQYFSNSLILIRSIVPSKKLKWKTRKNG